VNTEGVTFIELHRQMEGTYTEKVNKARDFNEVLAT
jgi:DNA-binding ferritin-like protein